MQYMQQTFCFNFWKPLKFILGLPKWKFYATVGPHRQLLTGPFSLNPPLVLTGQTLVGLILCFPLTFVLQTLMHVYLFELVKPGYNFTLENRM